MNTNTDASSQKEINRNKNARRKVFMISVASQDWLMSLAAIGRVGHQRKQPNAVEVLNDRSRSSAVSVSVVNDVMLFDRRKMVTSAPRRFTQ